MDKYVIIPDANCDLTKELRERFHVEDYIPGTIVFPDGTSHLSDLDWSLIGEKEFFDSMKNKNGKYSTSFAPVGEIEKVYEKWLENGYDILILTLSSGLSGACQAYLQVANDLKEKYPERTIKVVDSLRYCMAFGLLVIKACELQQQGKSLDEVVAWLEENRQRVHQFGTMDDLFYLFRSGRIKRTAAVMGTLVGINPMADFDRQGKIATIAKAKGTKTALKAVVEYIKRSIVNPEEQIIFISHSNRHDRAVLLKEMIEKEIKCKEVIINSVNMTCGVNIGPGLCAAYFFGSPISENNEEEIKLINEILRK